MISVRMTPRIHFLVLSEHLDVPGIPVIPVPETSPSPSSEGWIEGIRVEFPGTQRRADEGVCEGKEMQAIVAVLVTKLCHIYKYNLENILGRL